jgi:ubiquinone/menaquinone biosynthesis C-methylase UbiE
MATKEKQNYFNELAPCWDSLPAMEDAEAKVRAFIERSAVPDARRILDCGCGTGILLPWLLQRYSAAEVFLELDLAQNMLKVNAANFPQGRIHRVCADGARLPFRGACFDLVLCFGVLPHLEHLTSALAEMRRVLRPGGALAIGHPMGSRELNAFHQSLGEPVAGDVLPPSSELAEMLSAGGLAVVEAEESPAWYFVQGKRPL